MRIDKEMVELILVNIFLWVGFGLDLVGVW